MIIGDLEADGLLDIATTVWCANFYDTTTDKWLEYSPKTLEGYLEPVTLARLITDVLDLMISEGQTISFHNGVCYDIPLLEKLVPGWEFKGKLFDTLFASRILWPDRAPDHKLESWGETFGIHKPKHDDWSQFSEAMLYRNKEDVKIGIKLTQHIIEYVTNLSITDPRITKNKISNIFLFEQQIAKIIEEQARNGWLFDLELGYKLEDELRQKCDSIATELLPSLPLRIVRSSKGVTKAFTAEGEMTVTAKKWFKQIEDSRGLQPAQFIQNCSGDFCKVKFEPMNLNSKDQVKNYLLKSGWNPTNWNYEKDKFNKPVRDKKGDMIKKSPKIPKEIEEWDEIAELTNNPAIKLLAEYNKASHRLGQVKGLISNVRSSDHRIEAQANSCGCNTTRMQHRIVVNIPKAEEKVYYGKQMRSLFICPPDRVILGIDASALEARVEASYLFPFDPDAAREILEGDIHEKNSRLFGVSRSLAKSGKYALTYGCSPTKLAAILKRPAHEANKLYDAYWEGNPGLKQLKEKVEEAYKKHGYLLAIDGRPLSIRYKHALINTLFQSAGSIIMKKALILFSEILGLYYDKDVYKFIGNFHDEIQLEVHPSIAVELGNLGVNFIRDAAKEFNMKVPFTGEFKIGKNWSETH